MNGYVARYQRGAALIVTLVILVVMTLLGISAIDSSNLNLKIASSDKNRQVLFQAAEATLAIAEQVIENQAPDDTVLQDCTSGSSDCFDDTCANGLCFNGVYSAGDSQYDCSLSLANPPPEKFWRDSALNVWEDGAKHFTANVNGLDEDPKYIIEFLCFVERGDGSTFDASNPNNGAPLFRVTALAESADGRGRVMLQSTYRFVN